MPSPRTSLDPQPLTPDLAGGETCAVDLPELPDESLPPPPRGPRSPEHEARVADPQVTALITRLLGAWIAEEDRHPDLLQEIRYRLLVCANPPDTMERLLRLTTTITRGKVIDVYRHDEVVEAIEAGAFEEQSLEDHDRAGAASEEGALQEAIATATKNAAPADATDAVDVRERRQFVEQQIAAGVVSREDVEVAARTGTGETTYEEEARRRNAEPGSLRVQTHRVRTVLRTAYARFTVGTVGTVFLLWLVMAILAALTAGDIVSAPPPHDAAVPEPAAAPSQR